MAQPPRGRATGRICSALGATAARNLCRSVGVSTPCSAIGTGWAFIPVTPLGRCMPARWTAPPAPRILSAGPPPLSWSSCRADGGGRGGLAGCAW